MIAAEELARLRVPLASLPGFDPIGLRCWTHTGHGGLCVEHGYAMGSWGIRQMVRDGIDNVMRDIAFAPDACGIDLADASTADRVARWVAGRVGLEVGCTAPSWYYHEGGWYIAGDECWTGIVELSDKPNYVAGLPVEGTPRHPKAPDDRRLPDGSLYVDRLALALVAVHVGSSA